MRGSLQVVCARASAALMASLSVLAWSAQLPGAVAQAQSPGPAAPITGPPGYAMAEPVAGQSTRAAVINASYTHTPAPNGGNDLPAGSGQVMTSTTIYYDFWLPTGQTYEGSASGDTKYENLLIRWAQDLGSTQYHNLITQYTGTNGTAGNSVTYGGSWVDTATAYPHAGTIGDPLQDSDIRTEVTNAVTTNGWTEDVNHIVAVFTATGIHECMGGDCTYNKFCAYHGHFNDGGNDAVYAFMAFDNFVHQAGKTCVAGQTGGEIGDACNFNFAPRNDIGADVYMNGHPYIVQQEWSNAVHTCAIDLPTNGFCSGSVSSVCSPTVTFAKSVDNATPKVTRPINYTIALNNTSDSAAATNLSVTDTVPGGYVITNLSAPSSTSASNTSTSITVGYDTLPVHQSRTITVTATVPVQPGTVATNCGGLALQDLLQNALSPLTTSPCASTTPIKITTSLTFLGASKGDFNDSVTLSATLTDDMGAGINSETVDFSLNGTDNCSGTTDPSGNVSCLVTPSEAAGPYTVAASFGGDSQYGSSSASATFTVLLEEASITSSASQQLIQQGAPATLSALLTDPDGAAPIAGKSVTITLGSDGGSQSCIGTTTGAGVATCTIGLVTVAQGPQIITDAFAGDAYYVPASNIQSALIYAYPDGGDFAIGNLSTGGTVHFWGSQWSTANSLSGGGAPSAFKGFENGTLTPTCGSTIWSTVGGNSPPPPATIPSYMAVIVTSSVKKSGNTISGNIVAIFIVKTDPGYAPDPAVPGTGTVVAILC